MQTVYHIALLDDEPCYTNMIRDKIEAFGLEEQLFIDTYNNVNDFLRSKHIYDILLLDIEMPGMDGIHLAKYIANERTLVIYVTNYADRMEDAFGINVFRYVLKSKIDEKLKRTLQDALSFYRITLILRYVLMAVMRCLHKRISFIWSISLRTSMHIPRIVNTYFACIPWNA